MAVMEDKEKGCIGEKLEKSKDFFSRESSLLKVESVNMIQ